MLTVKQLITKLKKLDQNALVAWRDHDNGADEINAFCGRVEECDESLLEAKELELTATGKNNIVILRAR